MSDASNPLTNTSRGSFDQLGTVSAPDDTMDGTPGADHLSGDPVPAGAPGLPGALAFWTFDNGLNGAFGDARGGPAAMTYERVGDTAQAQAAPLLTAGPDDAPNSALLFDGENDFGFIHHDPSWEVTQGTVALWLRPDDLSDDAIVLSKDQSGAGDGGHFRLGHRDDGRVFLRFAEGDGGSNKAWTSSAAYLEVGEWTHVAVSFTDEGITVYVDGVAIPPEGWYREEGNVDSPADFTEAYLLQNREPWLLGADTAHIQNNDTPESFAAQGSLDDAFAGAIADFGIWGGFTPEDALSLEQVFELYTNGPGTALTAPSGAQPMLAGNDTITGEGGNDIIQGDAGDDTIVGGDGDDELRGGYGNDLIQGGAGNDILEDGRGSDLLIGGEGDDLIILRSDAGEQRIGQLAIGQPTRDDPDGEVNPAREKLYGWEDQPLIGDDIAVGGAGRDTFLINPQINAKRDIILEHVDDTRIIDWAGVAGENDELHDHWVDSAGINLIADFVSGEDTIAIIGHTARPYIRYEFLDTNGDGLDDKVISIIDVYSVQHGGGGAHTQDLITQLVVHGDIVTEDDIVNDDGVTHGIVKYVDQIQEALAPTGETKISTVTDESGVETQVYGYDTRSYSVDATTGETVVDLGAVTGRPQDFIDNPFLDGGLYELGQGAQDGLPAPVALLDVLSHPAVASMSFTGDGADVVNIDHVSGLERTSATYAFTFTADTPGDGWQTLFSKDASGYVDGGHLTAWVTSGSEVKVRYQSTSQTVYLYGNDVPIEAGEANHFAFSFDGATAKLFLNGVLVDVEDLTDNQGFETGQSDNGESLVFGASATSRPSGTVDNLKDFFDGTIENVVVLDRPLAGQEALLLARADGDLDAIGGLDSSNPPNTPADAPAPGATTDETPPPVTTVAANANGPVVESVVDLDSLTTSRGAFDQLGTTPASHDEMPGTDGPDVLSGDPAPAAGPGLPGALAFWAFDDGVNGAFGDARGGPAATAYERIGATARLQDTPLLTSGPDDVAGSALLFDGQNDFGFIHHDPSWEVTQGTVALWLRPDDLSDDAIVLSKDQSGAGDGGHFRLGHRDDGRVFLRFAEGDGGSNKAWTSSAAYLEEGAWSHIAVSFTDDGITVYVNGVAIPDEGYYREEGNVDSPADFTEAYLLQNQEPWLLGADTSRTKNNDTPDDFAADNQLRDAFKGAIADFGIWGGFTPDDALSLEQVFDLYTNGPGTALTEPSGAQPMLAGNDTITGEGGNDIIQGDAGDDTIVGGDGDDELRGGYGNDLIQGGAGNDILEDGRGSDLLIGGEGDDLIILRSDAGEQRIGQLAIGQPTRDDPDGEVNPAREKLYGWEDQPLVGDDIAVGGAGRDTFLINPQINAKRDIILEHVDDTRIIDWAGVAGENDELHDHWVDSAGINLIADFVSGEDTIAIIGHTARPYIRYEFLDTDGDGLDDKVISIVDVYSVQHGGGGAHTQDLITQLVVHGDIVTEDDIVNDDGVTHGIVKYVDQIQEALAPTGETKISTVTDESGVETQVYGYDTRSYSVDASTGETVVDLGAVTGRPQDFIDNPYLDSGLYQLGGAKPAGVPDPVALLDETGFPQLDAMSFEGDGSDIVNLPHFDALARDAGTYAFSFTGDTPGEGWQTLFSKDASGYVDGGHLTAWIAPWGEVKVRYQSTSETVYLHGDDVPIEAGQTYQFAFSFEGSVAKLYINGFLTDTETLTDNQGFEAGMTGNSESLVFGASATTRTSGQLNNLKHFFDGSIDNVLVIDRPLYPQEALLLAQAGGDFDAIGDSAPPVTSFAIEATDAVKAEGDSGMTQFHFTVTRSGDLSGADQVDFAVRAADAADFGGSLPSGTVSFAAGETSQLVTVEVSGDTVFEADETFTVTLANASSGGEIVTASAEGTILNDDAAPPATFFEIAATDAVKAEGDAGSTLYSFTVTRSGDLSGSDQVGFAVTGDGADAADFGGSLPSGTVSFAAGETSQLLTVEVSGDSEVERDEGFTVTLANPSAGSAITTVSANGLIENDDSAPSSPPVTLVEAAFDSPGDTEGFSYSDGVFGGATDQPYADGGWSDGALAVTLGGKDSADIFDMSGAWQIDFTLDSEMAVSLSFDYALTMMPTYEPNEFSQVLFSLSGEAPVVLDQLNGRGPSQTTGLQSYSGDLGVLAAGTYTLSLGGYNNQKTYVNELSDVTIDNVLVTGTPTAPPSPPVTSFAIEATDAVKAEGDSGMTQFHFTVSRSGDLSGTEEVAYAVNGGGGLDPADFGGSLPSGSLVFAPGQSSQRLTIEVSGDSDFEADESFTVSLSSPSAGIELASTTAEGMILNDDPAPPATFFEIAATDAVKAEGDAGSTLYSFTVTRSGDLSEAGQVDFAVSGAEATDFGGSLPSGSLAFAAGEGSQVLTLAVSGDTAFEADETFTVTLANPSTGSAIATARAEGTILNDDPAPPATFFEIAATDAVKAEGDAGNTLYSFTVTRSGLLAGSDQIDFAVTGAGADAADFGGSLPGGTVSFAAGETSQVVTVAVSGDSEIEDDETFTVTLANASAGSEIITAAAEGTILNDDAPPPATSFEIAPADATKLEGDAGATLFDFTVTRSGDLSGIDQVDYQVTGSGLDAAISSDFLGGLLPDGTLTFAAGETSKTVTVDVAGDGLLEPDESFTVSLVNPSAGTTVTTASASGTILNDDEDSGVPGQTILVDADFDAAGDTEGFTYADGSFGGAANQIYAYGQWFGGTLFAGLGGLDSADVFDISGGWQIDFTLDSAMSLSIAFDYELSMSAAYEGDEFAQVLYGLTGESAVVVDQLVGGGPVTTTGPQSFAADLGVLAAGDYSLSIGGYNNQKDHFTEGAWLRIDDVLVTGNSWSLESTGGGAPAGPVFAETSALPSDDQDLTNLTVVA